MVTFVHGRSRFYPERCRHLLELLLLDAAVFLRIHHYHRLATVYLEEEKNRIIRLRKIKSVLASGNYIGAAAPSKTINTQNNRRRRRPHPDSLHQAPTYTNRSRHDPQSSLAPKCPQRLFGNIVPLLPATLEVSTTLEQKDNNKQHHQTDGSPRYDYASAARSHTNSHDESRGEDTGTKFKHTAPLPDGRGVPLVHEIANNCGDGHSRSRRHSQEFQHPSGVDAFLGPHGDVFQQKSHSEVANASSSTVKDNNMAVSSGASAIDLFDQCGLVPAAAVEFAGLVGTSREENQRAVDSSPDIDSAAANGREPIPQGSLSTPAVPSLSIKPPLAPRVSAGMRGRHGLQQRDLGDTTDSAGNRNRRTNESDVQESVDKARPPFLGGAALSTKNRVSPTYGVRRGVEVELGKTVRGAVPGGGGSTTVRRSRSPGHQGSKMSVMVGSANTKGESSSGRVRRRWSSTSDGSGGAPGASVNKVANTTGRAGAVRKEGRGDEIAATTSSRIASAQAQLRKDKDLEALKSEHVEALSILQDINAPSIAAPQENLAEKRKSGEEKVAKSKSNITNLAGRKNSTTRASVSIAEKVETRAGSSSAADVNFDDLSANLPRIGSREQAVLRTLYRKWWMKIANDGVYLPPSTPDAVDMLETGLEENRLDKQIDDVSTADASSVGPKKPAETIANPYGIEGVSDNQGRSEGSQPDAFIWESTIGAVGMEKPRLPVHPITGGTYKHEGESRVGEGAEPAGKDEVHDSVTNTSGDAEGCNGDDKGSDKSIPELAASSTHETPEEFSSDRSSSSDANNRVPDIPNGTSYADVRSGESYAPRPTNIKTPDESTPISSRIPQSSVTIPSPSTETCPAEKAPLGQPQQRHESDPNVVPDDDGLTTGEEEGLHGRIYLSDGRFVSTRRYSSKNVMGAGDEIMDRDSTASDASDSSEYDDEDFEA